MAARKVNLPESKYSALQQIVRPPKPVLFEKSIFEPLDADSASPARLNLLIVDDDALLRNSLSQIFLNFGHSVRTASDGFSALRAMRQHLPDILLSDLHMPGMSGFELLSVVRRRFPAILTLAMSSTFNGTTVPTGIAADGYYEKAAKFATLLELMDRMSSVVRNPQRFADLQAARQAASPSGLPAPTWVAKNGHHPSGEAYVMLTCPDCLRIFPQVLQQDWRKVASTGCTHCNAEMEYAVVHPAEPEARGNFAQPQPQGQLET